MFPIRRHKDSDCSSMSAFLAHDHRLMIAGRYRFGVVIVRPVTACLWEDASFWHW
jgi:hypothetical protein